MLLSCGVGEDSWEYLGLQGDPASPSSRKSVLNIHWKDWCWSWNSNTLPTWCEEPTHWKRHWCWEKLKTGGEGDDRGWDGGMALPTQWKWIWANSGRWWRTGEPGILLSMGLQSQTELSNRTTTTKAYTLVSMCTYILRWSPLLLWLFNSAVQHSLKSLKVFDRLHYF